MPNYLKSEWYRLTRKKEIFWFLLLCLAAPFFVTLLTAVTGGVLYANTEFAFKAASSMWSLLFFIIPVMTMLLVADEFTDGTLKNTVAFGITRKTIFYGKWIMQLLFLIVAWLLTYLSLTASVFLLLDNNGTEHFSLFTSSMAGVMPLALAALTVSHCVCFLKEKPLPHLVIYAAIVIILPELYYTFASRLSAFSWVVEYFPLFPYAAANDRVWLQANGLLLCWASGAAYVLLSFLLSSRSVRLKEFK